jgi:hypothetical protein
MSVSSRGVTKRSNKQPMESRRETTSSKQRDKEAIARRQPTARSAVSNGRRLFVAGDGRSPWSRRYYDLIAAHVADMGGRANLSEAQVALIKRAATLEVELEQMEGKLSLGETIDLDVFGRATGNLRRVWDSLGLRREPRDVTLESDQSRLNRILDLAAEEANP